MGRTQWEPSRPQMQDSYCATTRCPIADQKLERSNLYGLVRAKLTEDMPAWSRARSEARTHGIDNTRVHLLGPGCALGRLNARHGNAEITDNISISGLVAEYIVAIDVTRVRFLADAFLPAPGYGQQHAYYVLDPRNVPQATS